jgi:hypothetical protein
VITLSELLAEEYKEQGIAFNVLALGSANRNARRSFSGLPSTYFGCMAQYIFDFTLTGNTYFNGKVLQVSSNP